MGRKRSKSSRSQLVALDTTNQRDGWYKGHKDWGDDKMIIGFQDMK